MKAKVIVSHLACLAVGITAAVGLMSVKAQSQVSSPCASQEAAVNAAVAALNQCYSDNPIFDGEDMEFIDDNSPRAQ